MATNYMLGNTTVYTIYPETTYGVRPTTASVEPLVIGLKVDMKKTLSLIDRPLHTGAITDATCNTVNVGSEASVTIDGAWSLDYVPLLKSYMQNSGSSYSDSTFGTDLITFTIFQYDTANPTKCRYATGCKVKSINLTVQQKDTVKMSALLVGSTISEWVARPTMDGSYAHYTTLRCHNAEIASNVAIDGVVNITSLTLNMDSLLVDDAVRYANSLIAVNQIMTKKMITLEVEQLFDPSAVAPGALFSNYDGVTNRQTLLTIGDIIFKLNLTTQDYTLADPDAGVWKNSYSLKAVKSAEADAILITLG